jgi:hypothetical protein
MTIYSSLVLTSHCSHVSLPLRTRSYLLMFG